MSVVIDPQAFASTIDCLGAVTPFNDAPDCIYSLDNPYLHGVYAPVVNETQASQLTVEGDLPSDLRGAYLRNGPNPQYQPKNRYHPFDGDGMIHRVEFDNGQASYSNRWVATAALADERRLQHSFYPGVMGPFDYSVSSFGIKDTSNTDVFVYDGDVMSLWYNAGHPYRLDGKTLQTKGFFDIAGRSHRRMSAHSKVDPHTGELLFFDYGDEPPYLTYGVANAQGKLIKEMAIDLPGPRLPHYIGVSRNYTVLHDLPFFHDMNVLRNHNYRVLTFYRDMPILFGVIPRYGEPSDIRWFECESGYILHVSNCWEDGDWLFMDGCR